jgi:uncharacterized protein YybS (DUF2232 family)
MMASRAFPLAIIGGLLAGLLCGAMLTGSFGGMVLFWMAALPLFVVGIRLGLRLVAVAGLVGTVAVSIGEPAVGLVFAVMVALPVLLMTGLTLSTPRPRTAGALVLGLTALGLAYFAVACLLAAGQPGGLEGSVTATVKEAVDQTARQFPELVDISAERLDQIGLWLPGFSLALWLVIFAGNGILAQGLAGRIGGAMAPGPAMAEIALPRLVGVAFVAAVLAAAEGSGGVAFAGWNLAEILAVPLMFGGLGVVHAALARHPVRAGLLTAFYAVVLGFGFPIALIVALGLIEQWVELRRRFAVAPRQGEE